MTASSSVSATLPPRSRDATFATGSSSLSRRSKQHQLDTVNATTSSQEAQTRRRRKRFTNADAEAVYRLSKGRWCPGYDDEDLSLKVKDALNIIEQAVDRYGLEHLALSFNGGKDCTVLVHLLAAVALRKAATSKLSSQTSLQLPRLKSVYVRCLSPFPQVEHFVNACTETYNLDLMAVEGGMKEALQEYLDKVGRNSMQKNLSTTNGNESKQVEAILVGTRRNDPHGAQLTPFDPTDKGWPNFMRVHPILDWSYKQIWDFLRHPMLTIGDENQSGDQDDVGTIEWCELYDYGYTSLGSTHNTFPNPLLRTEDEVGLVGGWRPAWDLQDGSQERAGRERLADRVLQKQQAIGDNGKAESGGGNATI
ncbi:3'-phosphoadenosine 5'-phosphosulfate sulfotransferase [Microbotryomycetes sp. JL221]|nr:3'-phosphoadenosine 5'-phosphosulfate sulfotransferase [Microbotryomycetes sp. JL221]